MKSDFAILIIAFKRPDALELLLQQVSDLRSPNVYIALDAPRNSLDFELNKSCREKIELFSKQYPGEVHTKYSDWNIGCAGSVLQACGWAFTHEEFLAIIEDDCMPDSEFFDFIRDSKKYIDHDPKILLACGSQFVPSQITKKSWTLSKYPLIWGWATSKTKWLIVERLLKEGNTATTPISKLLNSEYLFWRAGARRAFSGYVDAWDIPLAFKMQEHDYKSIISGTNLVKNIGDDSAATHTFGSSPWINFPLAGYHQIETPPQENSRVDTWLKRNVYQISVKHIATTKITLLLDSLGINTTIREKLVTRF